MARFYFCNKKACGYFCPNEYCERTSSKHFAKDSDKRFWVIGNGDEIEISEEQYKNFIFFDYTGADNTCYDLSGQMSLDAAFEMIFKAITKKAIKWNDFTKVGVDEYYHDYYYAEDELYIIHDRIFDTIEFVKARSPKEALEISKEKTKAIVYQED